VAEITRFNLIRNSRQPVNYAEHVDSVLKVYC